MPRALRALAGRLPVGAVMLLFIVAALAALAGAALIHARLAEDAHRRLAETAAATYRGLAAAAPPTAEASAFEAAARLSMPGSTLQGLGVYHTGLGAIVRAGAAPETISAADAALAAERPAYRTDGDALIVVFLAPQEAGAPLIVLARVDARAAAAAVADEARLVYLLALLLAAAAAAFGAAALWRGHLDPARRLAELARHPRSLALPQRLLARRDAAGLVARDLDGARRAGAEIERERAETEERIETTLRQRARQLFEAKERAEAANRAKSTFLANMSHELRTPLNAVIGFSGIMQQQMLGPLGAKKYVDYAADINRSATHLLGIVNDILDMSKVEAAAVDLKEEAFAVAPLVEECAAMLRDRVKAKNISFAVNAAPTVPEIRADRRRIKQVLLNLLSNAEKFTEAGGRIGLYATTAEGGGVKFVVTDTGIGMSAADIETAMTPFRQVDTRLARKYEGTGLGLPLTKAMVEMHQGRFVIESAPGKGTTVTVFLPAERCVSARAPIHEAA
jgi:signal transduction histidine kinase